MWKSSLQHRESCSAAPANALPMFLPIGNPSIGSCNSESYVKERLIGRTDDKSRTFSLYEKNIGQKRGERATPRSRKLKAAATEIARLTRDQDAKLKRRREARKQQLAAEDRNLRNQKHLRKRDRQSKEKGTLQRRW